MSWFCHAENQWEASASAEGEEEDCEDVAIEVNRLILPFVAIFNTPGICGSFGNRFIRLVGSGQFLLDISL